MKRAVVWLIEALTVPVLVGAFALAMAGLASLGSGNARASSVQYPYTVERVTYLDRTLYCIVRPGDGYGVGSGMSCDFARFYRGRRP